MDTSYIYASFLIWTFTLSVYVILHILSKIKFLQYNELKTSIVKITILIKFIRIVIY